MTVGKWSAAEDRLLSEMHGSLPLEQIASAMGRSRGSIRARVTTLGLSKQRYWTPEEEELLRRIYNKAGAEGFINLTEVAKGMGRDKTNVSRKARQLGLNTNSKRKCCEQRKVKTPKFTCAVERRSYMSALAKERIASKGHPRGMAGKRHTQETVERLVESSKATWARMTPEEREIQNQKAVEGIKSKGGYSAPNVQRGTWKAGWREIGGQRNYFRSRWEANYARYLQWLKDRGEISDWKYEPETFWFDAIRRGVRSYKPDFRVWENDGSSKLHEVKGWMDSRSKTTLSRMAKYHPSEQILLIDGRQYRTIRIKVMRLIPEWEDSARDTHA